MIGVLTGLLGDALPWIGVALAALGGLFLWGRSKERKGRRQAEAEMAHDKMEATDEARSVERRARRDGAPAAREFLRSRKTTDRKR